MYKICNGPVCRGEVKPATEFYRNKARADGLSSQCKSCQSEYQARKPVRERRHASNRNRIATDPEFAANNCARAARWIRENPDRYRAARKRYEESPKRKCAIDDCLDDAVTHTGRALCSLHQRRVYAHGDPFTVLPTPSGEAHPMWVGDRAGYAVAHTRVAAARGKASEHRCAARCGRQAAHWSYRGGAPDERTELMSPTGAFNPPNRSWYAPFSLDASFYDPLCRGCHVKRDVWKKDVLSNESA